VALDGEPALYAALGLAWIPPELREGRGEVEAAKCGPLPRLLELSDLRGSLHNHTSYSDGGATVREMADAAIGRGWSYIGITDHSVGAFYAGGMKPAAVLRQHEEIDLLNASYAAARVDFRVLKGVEADILPDGRVDYDDAGILERFDYVIGSVHSQFRMSEAAMTERVCRALQSPFLTILGHPTGRLLLARDAFAIDIDAVLETAASTGTSVELNADAHRLDLDWRLLRQATSLGIAIEVGPDAHSTAGLDNVRWGVNVARKGWVTAAHVLNARSADDVLAFARAKRERVR
jgi:DNA polymerase (family X)